ncbi:sulfur oxidation c-type cytochrome SoxX [Luminiphilus sp.]|jgi:sulfur-oxidizing protein SoxX|nr:sulfur oxidation c-type cytochrome SoxX [Luminiphilus sp.]MDC0572751.1 sulfur oxidation c-type cytochrome SoxX [Luminiphilus sp.]
MRLAGVARIVGLSLVAGSWTSAAEDIAAVLESSFIAKNQATMARLQQDAVQEVCSAPRGTPVEETVLSDLRQQRLDEVVLPADGVFLGDWQRGAEVAGNGRGLQSSDDPTKPNGGNCYACHQLAPDEVAYGTLGPSLTGYGARGQSEPMLRYTWTKLWDTHAYNLCSHMPRFGAQGILSEQQLRDVMAYLLDPASPVNQTKQ